MSQQLTHRGPFYFSAILLSSLLLSACANQRLAPPDLTAGFPLSSNSLGETRNAQQHLVGHYSAHRFTKDKSQAQKHEMLALIEATPDVITLVGMSGLGNRILTIRLSGEDFTVDRSPLLPAQLDAFYVLRDIQFCFWPEQALRDKLEPNGWRIETTPNSRAFYKKNQLITQVQYEGATPWSGKVHYTDKIMGYTLDINPLD
ncbi:MAG: DUF3261 domain-containing protein [Gammaproteobacteria bacterium]|nr:DUF3261 domain-containing protein [Gammaproteobacteria bacterium]